MLVALAYVLLFPLSSDLAACHTNCMWQAAQAVEGLNLDYEGWRNALANVSAIEWWNLFIYAWIRRHKDEAWRLAILLLPHKQRDANYSTSLAFCEKPDTPKEMRLASVHLFGGNNPQLHQSIMVFPLHWTFFFVILGNQLCRVSNGMVWAMRWWLPLNAIL